MTYLDIIPTSEPTEAPTEAPTITNDVTYYLIFIEYNYE